MRDRIYIDDFCYDLNYARAILYIGGVNKTKLRNALKASFVNKLWRFEYATSNPDPSRQNFIYIENCDLQDLNWPVHEYIADGYDVYNLHEDNGKYYIKEKL
jgi:hypothetical protein